MFSTKISIFGTGYVGLVTGVCLADLGHNVTCVDIDEKKIQDLNVGKSPIYELGLEELIGKNKANLTFTTNTEDSISSAEVIFIGVGTPQQDSGEANLSFVSHVTDTIAKNIKNGQIIVVKSTVPIGTNDWIQTEIQQRFNGNFEVISNPEFLREGTAVYDFFHPDRIVLGGDSKQALKVMQELYQDINAPYVVTDRKSAELIKYASNSFLATKISFINSIANLAEAVGADIETVSEGMGLDSRIGSKFLKAGIGYGGSCFSKDVQALLFMAQKNGVDLNILQTVEDFNNRQKLVLVKKLTEKIDSLSGKKIAVLGLSFKPDTDDIREAPSLIIIQKLLEKDAQIWAWDPLSETAVEKIYPNVHFCPSLYDAIDGAEAVMIVTEWDEIKKLDLKKVKKLMKGKLVLDGRNILDKQKVQQLGLEYIGIGR